MNFRLLKLVLFVDAEQKYDNTQYKKNSDYGYINVGNEWQYMKGAENCEEQSNKNEDTTKSLSHTAYNTLDSWVGNVKYDASAFR